MEKVILPEVTEAMRAVSLAEHALEVLLEKIQQGPRAEKVTASEPIQSALDRLHAARDALAVLELDQLALAVPPSPENQR